VSCLLTPSLSATYLVISIPLLSSLAIVEMRICLHIRRRRRITSSFLARPSRPHRTNGVLIKAAKLTIPQQIRRRRGR
jgi:hypothetical protein